MEQEQSEQDRVLAGLQIGGVDEYSTDICDHPDIKVDDETMVAVCDNCGLVVQLETYI